MAIKIKTEVSEKDFFDYHKFNILRVSLVFKIVFILLFVFLSLTVYLSFTNGVAAVLNTIKYSWPVALMLPFLIWIQRGAIKKSYANNSFIREGQEYLFDENSFKVAGGDKERTIGYSTLKYVYISPKFIYLYMPSRRAFIIKRNYLDSSKLDELLLIFSNNMVSEKIKIIDASLK